MAVTYEALNAYGGPHILCCRQRCEDNQDTLRYHVALSKFRMITFHDLMFSICAMVRQRVAASFLIGKIWRGLSGTGRMEWSPGRVLLNTLCISYGRIHGQIFGQFQVGVGSVLAQRCLVISLRSHFH